MRREHRPLFLLRARSKLDELYARRYLVPQFDEVGEGTAFTNARYIHVFGTSITLGKYVHIAAIEDNHVRLSVWPLAPGLGKLSIGDYSVINPGVRVGAGHRIEIGCNAILASNVYITDADWHGRYDRVFSPGGHAPVIIEDNVWLSERVVVGKGVRIGENSIVGAGSIVVSDIPKNSIAAGNPARVVRPLDPSERFVSRSHVYAEPGKYQAQLRGFEELMTQDNTLATWLRYLWRPTPRD